ncbi:hypothetical protein C1I95_31400 [Micromonospora craterilacus]|uniref:Uncharacterized protein n=1 Tax=Micromonospora craterilacus TaxID=1655439 RepID=A0A2W2DA52_9ACTN|nr:hypothetical protein [Micromonospora craterilacus]PZG07181.1 hypothetical protein C1I95_31400 [Micromonospora craterilacus]
MSDQTSTTAPADAPPTATSEGCAHLAAAETYMQNLDEFTRRVAQKLDEGYIAPHVTQQWAARQEKMMEVARTNALVSIAASLAVLAGRARPQPAPGGDTDGA